MSRDSSRTRLLQKRSADSAPIFDQPENSPQRLKLLELNGTGSHGTNGTVSHCPTRSTWITPMLTDFYQITMALAYFKSGAHNNSSVFEAFFRKNPFKGEYTLFAGLSEVLLFLESFKFTEADIAYIKEKLPRDTPSEFFEYLAALDTSSLTVYAVAEGCPVFAREPLVRIEGPLGLCQLLETTILNLLNFPTLVATNAARMRLAAGPDKTLLEFGLRRAQGPDGGMTASRYSIIGGFDGTSNVAAGQAYDLDIRGTHAHSFVAAFRRPDDLKNRSLNGCPDFYEKVLCAKRKSRYKSINDDELIAFVAYALAFPDSFNVLVDTYDTLGSGVPNFLAVAVAMHELGLRAKGVRLDSGDLATLSLKVKEMFQIVGNDLNIDLSYLTIVASNDINEEKLLELNRVGHAVDSFGIGTNLVTCQAQPALGMVYKLMEVSSEPVIKLSNELNKVTIPGRKRVFRLFNGDGIALCDVMTMPSEPEPKPHEQFICRHPYHEQKRFRATPSVVKELVTKVFENGRSLVKSHTTTELREIAKEQLATIAMDVRQPTNPVEYHVMLSVNLHQSMHSLWLSKSPMKELI